MLVKCLAVLVFAIPFFLSLLEGSKETGIKIVVQSVIAGHSTEQTTYLKADRKRMEFRNYMDHVAGPSLAAITRCDLGQAFELNLETAEYVSSTYPPRPLTQAEIEERGLDSLIATLKTDGRPTVRIETTTHDSGERKQVFGYTARHVITTQKLIPLQGSKGEPRETVRDGWYIDLDLQVSCDPRFPMAVGSVIWSKEAHEVPEFVNVGERERGLAVHEVWKSIYARPGGAGAKKKSRIETRVTQLQIAPLDPALFEIPPGFQLVSEIERNTRR